MLRKLLKHEFRATARVMLPLYLLTVVLALGTRLMDLWTHNLSLGNQVLERFTAFLTGLMGIGFVLSMMAVFVVAGVLMILRFRSNLLADEGYVMFTLPVSSHQLVWSKLIVSTVWFLGAVIIDSIAMVTLLADMSAFRGLAEFFQTMMQELDSYLLSNGIAIVVELLVLAVVCCLALCLSFYAPLAIGHSFAQHKMLLSVVFFFAIQVAVQVVSSFLFFLGIPVLNQLSWIVTPAHAMEFFHVFMWGSVLLCAVYCAVLYCLTMRMLNRHLNLE